MLPDAKPGCTFFNNKYAGSLMSRYADIRFCCNADQIRNISLGLPPNWTILKATALTVVGLTTYFTAFTFWTR